MAGLSVLKEGIFVVCANPIFPTSDVNNDTLTFEVFEADAASLKHRLGKIDQYCLDKEPFFGELVSIEMCRSSHPALAHLRDKPTMRGVMTIHSALSHARH